MYKKLFECKDINPLFGIIHKSGNPTAFQCFRYFRSTNAKILCDLRIGHIPTYKGYFFK